MWSLFRNRSSKMVKSLRIGIRFFSQQGFGTLKFFVEKGYRLHEYPDFTHA